MRSQSADRDRCHPSSSGCARTSAPRSARLRASSSSESVSGPATSSPVMRLRAPRSPIPCCTFVTCRGYQLAKNVERMPPW